MKVLHLISGGDTGGAKTHIIALLKGLNKRIDAKVICFIEDTFYHDALEEGVPIQVFKQKSRSDMSVINRLVDEIEENDYDIIHCHGARANLIALFLSRKVKKPFITTIHSDFNLDFKDNFYKRIVYTTLNKLALKRFDYYIAISDAFKDMLVERGFNSDDIFTVYNGIDMDKNLEYTHKEEFSRKYNIQPEGKTFVGIIARLDKVKDHETFLKAARDVSTKNNSVEFILAGEGNDEKRLKSLASEYGIKDKVHFIGFLKDQYSFYNAIDINVLTSVSESFPYAVLEGALMEKPIITTNVGGLSKLVENDVNGYLINVGDSASLADRILKLVENPELMRTFGKNLYDKVKNNYSSESLARVHEEIYNQILENYGGKQ